jgi:hypothetical protein
MAGYCILGSLLIMLFMVLCVKIAQVITALLEAHKAHCLCEAGRMLQETAEEGGVEAGTFKGPQAFTYLGPDGQPREAKRGSVMYEEILDSF